tara:strand:+ start:2102 stop:2662 length:561 start_codon:yes stop_codon:yes gene_type:complete
MKEIVSILIILFVSTSLNAQIKNAKSISDTTQIKTIDTSKVKTLDSTIKTLYRTISGEKGVERNWKLFQYLFMPGAKLIPSGKNEKGEYKVRYLKPEDYIKSSGKWLVENGFFEKELFRTVNTFGNITQVFSTYESFKSETDIYPFMRGINSIQLLFDGNRWWIINIYWAQESKEHPIPAEYLAVD